MTRGTLAAWAANEHMLWIMSMSPVGAPRKILIADDDQLLSEVLVRSLEAHGYDVSRAPAGVISPELTADVQLVILDAHIPGVDFTTTLRMLRERGVGVLVLSGDFAAPAGVPDEDYLGKPVDLPVLLAAVARLASGHSESLPAVVQPLSSIVDPAELRARSELRLRMAAKVARFGGWSLNVASGTNYWSDELCEMLGFPAGSPPAVGFAYSLYPDEDRALISAAMQQCAEHGTPFDQIRNIRDANGRSLRVRVVGEPLRNPDGQITHVEGALQDITDLEEERSARLSVAERLRSTLDSLTDGLMVFDSEWRWTYVNPRAEEILQFDGETVIGHTFWENLPEEVEKAFGDVMRAAMSEKRTASARGYEPGIRRWLEVTAYPTADGVAANVRDVTEDEAVQRDNAVKADVIASQAALLDIARDAIIVRRLDHTVEYCNRAAEDLYGWTPAEAHGRSVRELIHVDPAAFDAAMEVVVRDGYWSGDMDQRSRDGKRLIAECSWTLVRDRDGVPTSIFAVNTDVTARRRAEDLALRRRRMESLGTLAGGVAHDLNNVLTPLLLGMQVLGNAETDHGRLALLGTMEASVKRGADMIRQVLAFARGADGKRIVGIWCEF